jgi:thymidylate kinase
VIGRGFTVALIGCDGAGKTTVARHLEAESDLPLRYLYMGVSADSSNRQLPTTRLAHAIKRKRGAPPDTRGPRVDTDYVPPKSRVKRVRKSVRSTLRLTNRVAEEWYRQSLAIGHLLRGRIVLFDRHFTADYHAADIAAQRRTWSRRVHGFLLTHVYPQPDLVIFLDAPPEVLFARKGEGTIASLGRRRKDYLELGGTLQSQFAIVDATLPLETVVAQVADVIRDAEAHR